MKIAIAAVTPSAAPLARRLGQVYPQAEVWLPRRLENGDSSFYSDDGMPVLLPQLFARVDALICIMATGIVVRALAPVLQGKEHDPAVLVLDETGRFVISLLSGHLGGANAFARDVAERIGAVPVITTATDVRGQLAWDEAARLQGLVVEPVSRLRTFNSLLLEKKPIALVDREEMIAGDYANETQIVRAATFAAADAAPVAGRVYVTERLIPDLAARGDLLLLRPRLLAIGIGCNRGTAADEIEAAVRTVLDRAWLSPLAIGAVASIAEKADEAGLLAFCAKAGQTLQTFTAAELNGVAVPSPASQHARAAVGANGVCEPAALLAAGRGSLIIPKQKLGNVTVAVARRLPPSR